MARKRKTAKQQLKTPEERAIAIAIRLGLIDGPTQRLSGTQWIRLWAMIGMELAEKEPEFSRGRGRPPGGGTKPLPPLGPQQKEAQRRRWYRQRQRFKRSGKLIHLINWDRWDKI
jgi:hypothetical protein